MKHDFYRGLWLIRERNSECRLPRDWQIARILDATRDEYGRIDAQFWFPRHFIGSEQQFSNEFNSTMHPQAFCSWKACGIFFKNAEATWREIWT